MSLSPEVSAQSFSQSFPRVPFYLMRHGESVANKHLIWAGWMDTPLTHDGIQQAKDAHATVSQLSISKVYHSPLARAHDTAIYATDGMGLEFIRNDDLREANFGKYEGEHYSVGSIEEWLDGTFHEGNLGNSLCGNAGESFVSFRQRIVRALKTILSGHENSDAPPPILVCHGGVFGAIQSVLGVEDIELRLPNCGVVKFDPIEGDNWEVHMLYPEQKKL